MATKGPGVFRDTVEGELARHRERVCPACGREYDRGEGRVPTGYQIDHCPTCFDEIERRSWQRQSYGGGS